MNERPNLGPIIDTPKSASELYKREKNRIFRPARFYHQVEFTEKLGGEISNTITILNHGQGLYRGFTKTNNPDAVWYNARRVPISRNPGEFYYVGNCNDWSAALLVRLRALGIDRGALSLALCWYGSDAHLGPRGKAEGHMVLIIHTTKGDLVACSKLGLRWFGDNDLRFHRLTSMERGEDWVRVDENNSLLDLIEGAAI